MGLSSNTMPALEDITRVLAETLRPEKIILFGSWARGDARPDSDIDLFIQVPDGTDVRESAKRAYMAIQPLRALINRGIDIVVRDRSFVERYGTLIGTVVRPVMREGRLLYARP